MCKCWLCAKWNDLMVLRIRAQEAEKLAESQPFSPVAEEQQEQRQEQREAA